MEPQPGDGEQPKEGRDELPLELELQLSACVASGGSLRQSGLTELVRRYPSWRTAFGRWLRRFEARRDPASGAKRMGRYTLIRELGRGGMGIVYLAWDENAERWVGLKVMRDRSNANDEMMQRFHREARALAQLHHPAFVPVHEIGMHEESPFYAMELVLGASMDRFLREQTAEEAEPQTLTAKDLAKFVSRISPVAEGTFGTSYARAVATIGAQVAEALHAAHEQGFVHRDVKPSNVMLCADGSVRVLDFGLARVAFEPSLTGSDDVLGSPQYLSPEQLQGAHATDRRTDVYSLGVTLYELLALRPPYVGATIESLYLQILRGEPAPLTTWNKAVARDLVAVIEKAMQKERRDRYVTAAAMHADLQAYLDGVAVSARPVGTMTRMMRRMRRHKGAVVLGGVVCAALAIGGFLLTQLRGNIDTVTLLAEIRALRIVDAADLERWRGRASDLPNQPRQQALEILERHETSARVLGELQALAAMPGEQRAAWQKRVDDLLDGYRLLALQRLSQFEGRSVLDRLTTLDQALSLEELQRAEQRALQTLPDASDELRRRFAAYQKPAREFADLLAKTRLSGNEELAARQRWAERQPEPYRAAAMGLLARHAEGLAFCVRQEADANEVLSKAELTARIATCNQLLPAYANEVRARLDDAVRAASQLEALRSAHDKGSIPQQDQVDAWAKLLEAAPRQYAAAARPLLAKLMLMTGASSPAEAASLRDAVDGVLPFGTAVREAGWRIAAGVRWPNRVLDERSDVLFALVPGGAYEGRAVPTFYLAVTEVTAAQWVAPKVLAGLLTADGKRAPCPTSFVDAKAWCTRHGYRLPSADEWHHALVEGHQLAPAVAQANLRDTSPGGEAQRRAGRQVDRVRVAGSLAANALGLHDMLGNLWEWCAFDGDDAEWQFVVGGAYDTYPDLLPALRVAVARSGVPANVGFRPAFTP